MFRKAGILLLVGFFLYASPTAGQKETAGTPEEMEALVNRLIQEKRFDEAILEGQRLCDWVAARYGQNHDASARALHVLAYAYGMSGAVDFAIDTWHRSLEILEKLQPPNHPAYLRVAASLAEAYRRVDEQDDALAYGDLVLKAAKQVPERDARPWIARAEFIKGEIYGRRGQQDQAAQSYQKAASIYLADLEKDSEGYQKCITALEQLSGRMQPPILLSEQQKKLIAEFGYPDTFTLICYADPEINSTDTVRQETWDYYDLRTCFSFVNGTFASSDAIEPMPDDCLYPGYKPEAFRYGMSVDQVKTVLGNQEGAELAIKDLDLNLPSADNITVYASRQIFFGFMDDRLHYILTIPAQPLGGGEEISR